MVDGRDSAWRNRAPGPHRNSARQAMDGLWTEARGQQKTVKRPRQQPAHPQYANYWAPLTCKRHTMPHSAQPQHTSYWAPRMRKRHQQEHRPQRPTESSDPTQHAKGRTGDRPGPRKGATTQRTVTQGAGRCVRPPPPPHTHSPLPPILYRDSVPRLFTATLYHKFYPHSRVLEHGVPDFGRACWTRPEVGSAEVRGSEVWPANTAGPVQPQPPPFPRVALATECTRLSVGRKLRLCARCTLHTAPPPRTASHGACPLPRAPL